jgi:hypothetical protein
MLLIDGIRLRHISLPPRDVGAVIASGTEPMLRRSRSRYPVRQVRIRPAPQARWSAAKRSGSNVGLGPLACFPIPGKQVGDSVGGVIWKPGQHVSEPGLRIDVIHLAGLCRPPNYAELGRFPQISR